MANSSEYDYLFKLILIGDFRSISLLNLRFLLLGDSSAGKSSFLLRFSDDSFSSSYLPTIGVDFKIKTLTVEGKVLKLQLWDSAGQERFKAITSSYYRGASGIMILYDITSRETFENVPNWLIEVQRYANPNVALMLLGNKCELIESRVVPTKEGEQFAKERNIPFFEVSSFNGTNVEEAFLTFSKVLLKEKLSQGVKKQEEKMSLIQTPVIQMKTGSSQPIYELIKIILIGDSYSGKSAFIARLAEGTFSSSYRPTIGVDFLSKTMNLLGKNLKLQVWDTSGQERFRSITRSYYHSSRGLFLCYDITNRESFDNLETWIKELIQFGIEELVVMLIGTKSDLENQRKVSEKEGADFAERHGFLFMETSATAEDSKTINQEIEIMKVSDLKKNDQEQYQKRIAEKKLKQNAKKKEEPQEVPPNINLDVKVNESSKNNIDLTLPSGKKTENEETKADTNEKPVPAQKKIENDFQYIQALLKKYDIPMIEFNQISIDKNKKLGQGSFAKVFQGKWLETQDVAIKRFRKLNLAQSDNIIKIESVFAEIKAGCKLNHPKINRIFGVTFDEGFNLLVVQELAQGSLAPLLEEKLPLERKHRISLEIAEILVILKANKIIHRDLKPQNFLVTVTGNLQVCDFGSIKFLKNQETSALSQSSTFTMSFAPPEIVLQDDEDMGKVGYYSDIWSLGCIYFRIYYGRNLWKGYPDSKMMKFLLSEKLPPIQKEGDVPDQIIELIKKCLVFNIKKRITIEEVMSEMRKVLAGQAKVETSTGSVIKYKTRKCNIF